MRNRPPKTNQSWPKSKMPFEKIHIHFGESKGLKFLIAMDSYFNLVTAWLVKSTDTGETCKCLKELFNTYGYPKTIVSDNGSPFIDNY